MQQKAEVLLQAGHYDADAIRECAEKVALHWQQLMLKMEDRLKLVNASVAFYKTSEQVRERAGGYARESESDRGLFSASEICNIYHSKKPVLSVLTFEKRRMICGFLIMLSMRESDHVICFYTFLRPLGSSC